MTIGERIKKTREASNLTQEYIAKLVGVSTQAIYKYENNIVTNIPLDKIEKIAGALNVTAAYLMGWEVKEDSAVDPLIHGRFFKPKMKKVPLLGKTACGNPIYNPSDSDEFAFIDEKFDVDFALETEGDSMTGAGINDGDIVYFKAQEMVDNGQIAAVFIDNEVTLKRVYYYREKNKLVLQPENPAHEPLVYIGEELNTIRIIGRAVAHLRKL